MDTIPKLIILQGTLGLIGYALFAVVVYVFAVGLIEVLA